MSAENLSVGHDYHDASASTVEDGRYQEFSDVLTSDELEGLRGMSDRAVKTALTSAYFWDISDVSDYDTQVFGAYLESYFGDRNIKLVARQYQVDVVAIESLRLAMPGYLVEALPASIWRHHAEVEPQEAQIIEADFTPQNDEPVVELAESAPVIDIRSHSSKNEQDIRVADELEIHEKAVETPTFDSEFNFFDAAELIELDDQEWREQAQALFDSLVEKSCLKPAEMVALQGHIMDKKDRVKNTAYAIDKLRRQHKKTKGDGMPHKVKADWLLEEHASKKVNMVDALHQRLLRYNPEISAVQAQCIAVGIIRQLYEQNLRNEPKLVEFPEVLEIVEQVNLTVVPSIDEEIVDQEEITPLPMLEQVVTNLVASDIHPDDFAHFEIDDSPDEYDEDWVERALCAQTDPEAFFPEKGSSTKDAKRMCELCEVKDECLQAALQNDERFGVWGGMSERERRRLKKVVGDRKPTQSDIERVVVSVKQTPDQRMLQLVDLLSSDSDDSARFLEAIQYDEKIYDNFVSVVLTDAFARHNSQKASEILTKYFTSTVDGDEAIKNSQETLRSLREFVQWIEAIHDQHDEITLDYGTDHSTLFARFVELAESRLVQTGS